MLSTTRAFARRISRAVPVRDMSKIPSWATIDPDMLSGANPGQAYNFVNGEWVLPAKSESIPDPLNGEMFLKVPDTSIEELTPFIDQMKACPKTGLHNPLKNKERYLTYGDVSFRAASALRQPDVLDYFVRLIMRVVPKSYAQVEGEVKVTRAFLENFSGDQVRFLARSFGVPGDHHGQQSNGYRWPYGPVALISPFNFPIEIPTLQLMGALFMGNHVTLKVDSKVSVVMEQFLRMCHAECGMPLQDVSLLHSDGPTMNHLLLNAPTRMTQFTGSQKVAELLCEQLRGKVKIEDAGFDWKVLGPDVGDDEFVAYTCDQDAYASSGQKCSAQSLLFMHDNWAATGLEGKLRALASRRKLDDLTIGPVLTVTTQSFMDHIEALLRIPGARVMWGGKELEGHTIPKCYGAMQPTAVFVPLDQLLLPENFEVVTTEMFGPFQVVTSYNDESLPGVIEALERMENHLTAAVVSNDVRFQQKLLGHTVNGTTYVGRRARTTGAPQNHWFGPAGDPRGGALGTPESIQLVWSCHREIIEDVGEVPADWTTPKAT